MSETFCSGSFAFLTAVFNKLASFTVYLAIESKSVLYAPSTPKILSLVINLV